MIISLSYFLATTAKKHLLVLHKVSQSCAKECLFLAQTPSKERLSCYQNTLPTAIVHKESPHYRAAPAGKEGHNDTTFCRRLQHHVTVFTVIQEPSPSCGIIIVSLPILVSLSFSLLFQNSCCSLNFPIQLLAEESLISQVNYHILTGETFSYQVMSQVSSQTIDFDQVPLGNWIPSHA